MLANADLQCSKKNYISIIINNICTDWKTVLQLQSRSSCIMSKREIPYFFILFFFLLQHRTLLSPTIYHWKAAKLSAYQPIHSSSIELDKSCCCSISITKITNNLFIIPNNRFASCMQLQIFLLYLKFFYYYGAFSLLFFALSSKGFWIK